MKATRFAAIGECMLELRHQTEQQLQLSFAGDSYNVALYLARYSQSLTLNVDYVTAVGTDPYSDAMLQNFAAEHIGTGLIPRLPDCLPGLYFIRTDEQGERSFYYYRQNSAAKHLFQSAQIQQICSSLTQFDYLYLSGISLAILDDASQQQLLRLLRDARAQGAKIIFDTNYRPVMWPNKKKAQQIVSDTLAQVDIALPTFEDEQALFGDDSVHACLARLQAAGVKEIVIKCGPNPCFVAEAGEVQTVRAEPVAQVVDTTAAGDSFNAGYIAGRIQGLTPCQAATCGHKLASVVVTQKGAIMAQTLMPTLAINPQQSADKN